MARVKTLYVRDEDAATWEEAAKVAAEEGASLSEFVTNAIRSRVESRSSAISFELLSVDSFEPFMRGTAIRRPKHFYGRWIIKDARSADRGAIPGDVWSIAITQDGWFAAHVVRGGTPLFGTDADIYELQRTLLIPNDIVESVLEALKQQGWIVQRDS